MTREPDDDQQWLDLMAGRTAPDADARTRKEAAWLRAAMLSYRETAPPGSPAPADDRANRLLTRAREAGVLASAANDPRATGQPARRVAPWAQALAACVTLFAVALVFMPHPPEPDGDKLRGAPVQSLQAQDPAARREQLLHDLRAAGFDAQGYERLGRLGIDVDLPVPLAPAQAAALKQLGLAPPPGPSLQVEIITPTPPAQ